MPRQQQKYFWPASGITEADMDLLYLMRESSSPRVPITKLISRAIRHTYGQGHALTTPAEPHPQHHERKAA